MATSYTSSTTFTATNARYLATKVSADLKRMQTFHGAPSDSQILSYEEELIELLKAGYLHKITYGFKRNNKWITPTLCYTASDLSTGNIDDDPGRVPHRADTTNASFYSFLEYSSSWLDLSAEERDKFEGTLPFRRSNADAPGVDGYLESDRTYSSGGRSLGRSSVRTM